MIEKIEHFLNERNIENPLIKETVIFFIIKHIELYGDIIPFEVLIERLNSNIKKIEIVAPKFKENNLSFEATIGKYEGFDKNEIILYFDERDFLKEQDTKEAFIATLIHELTHAAYSIKQKDSLHSEKQVFSTTIKNQDERKTTIEGTITYLEPIINYITEEILEKPTYCYINRTKRIKELTNVIDSKKMIYSAFYSNEELFKECFSHLPIGSYDLFTEGMDWLIYESKISLRNSNAIMEKFFKQALESTKKKI